MPAKPIRAGRPATFHYREALRQLNQERAPYLVGGTYAFQTHTRIHRPTKDLDLFVNEADRDCVLETLHEAGWETRVEVPHWLAKARRGETFVDVIHSSGNGVARVDDLWFTHSVPGQVLGVETRLVPVEEMIWSKAFVMENYRFDGADVAHLLLIQGHRIDWDRLLLRFGRNWRVLLGHLLFFGFIYPEQQNLVPQAFLDTLLALLRREGDEAASTLADPSARAPSCRGTLLSRKQYRVDVEVWGFRDTRLDPDVRMSERDIAEWTLANPDASGVAAEA
jgi:hypothetical protein